MCIEDLAYEMACEIVSPNSPEWDKLFEDILEKLESEEEE